MNLQSISQVLPYLPHFAAIVRQRNLSRAAEELNISAPAVTHALNRLEKLLGVSLCIRTRSQFELTPEGERLARVASSVLDEMTSYSSELDGENSQNGHLCIGVIDDFENNKFQKALSWITTSYPNSYISILVLPSEEIIARLKTGDLDAGFGVFNKRVESLKYLKIGEERLHYYISSDHPLFRKKINTESIEGRSSVWIDNEARSRSEVEREIFKGRPNYKLKIRAFTNNTHMAIKLVETGAFIAPLPEDSINGREKYLKQISISKGPMTLDQEFVFNTQIRPTFLKKQFVKLFTAE